MTHRTFGSAFGERYVEEEQAPVFDSYGLAFNQSAQYSSQGQYSSLPAASYRSDYVPAVQYDSTVPDYYQIVQVQQQTIDDRVMQPQTVPSTRGNPYASGPPPTAGGLSDRGPQPTASGPPPTAAPVWDQKAPSVPIWESSAKLRAIPPTSAGGELPRAGRGELVNLDADGSILVHRPDLMGQRNEWPVPVELGKDGIGASADAMHAALPVASMRPISREELVQSGKLANSMEGVLIRHPIDDIDTQIPCSQVIQTYQEPESAIYQPQSAIYQPPQSAIVNFNNDSNPLAGIDGYGEAPATGFPAYPQGGSMRQGFGTAPATGLPSYQQGGTVQLTTVPTMRSGTIPAQGFASAPVWAPAPMVATGVMTPGASVVQMAPMGGSAQYQVAPGMVASGSIGPAAFAVPSGGSPGGSAQFRSIGPAAFAVPSGGSAQYQVAPGMVGSIGPAAFAVPSGGSPGGSGQYQVAGSIGPAAFGTANIPMVPVATASLGPGASGNFPVGSLGPGSAPFAFQTFVPNGGSSNYSVTPVTVM